MSNAGEVVVVTGAAQGIGFACAQRFAVMVDDAARRTILSRTPMGRLGTLEEIPAVAAFLASDEASYITGETINADGGRLGLNDVVPVAE